MTGPRAPFLGRRVLVGVTGGIAAFKTAALVSQLAQAGAAVWVVMTEPATRFVGPVTFAALSGHPVRTSIFDQSGHPLGAHIELAEQGELLCVAPASADFLARLATGFADDLLSTLALAFDGPAILAPAMNATMWQKASVQRNVAQLGADGYLLLGPQSGWQSCRRDGPGRMLEPAELLAAIGETLAATPPREPPPHRNAPQR